MNMSRLPSPPSESDGPAPSQEPVPLESEIRTTPIHPLLRGIRVPSGDRPSSQYHPVTCQPLNIEELDSQIQQLRKIYPSKAAALRAQEDIAKEVKQRMEEADRKRNEVQKLLEKKTKEWDMEYKVLSKYQELKASELPS